ncbi:hypothetical protein [Primorskyibacter sp. 2E233]|uniref:hypothetical protein n=1 Tax=Primorskyibacter sp. 2E233 TaxID=3413431 RepID=UPI003BF42685
MKDALNVVLSVDDVSTGVRDTHTISDGLSDTQALLRTLRKVEIITQTTVFIGFLRCPGGGKLNAASASLQFHTNN